MLTRLHAISPRGPNEGRRGDRRRTLCEWVAGTLRAGPCEAGSTVRDETQPSDSGLSWGTDNWRLLRVKMRCFELS